MEKKNNVVILGAGPAGLTAAYELSNNGVESCIVEKGDCVGGLARTVEYKGYLFDIGGHRFFTKVRQVQKIWEQVLGDDLLTRPRLSRIYYQSRFFSYPIEPLNALLGLGLKETILCGLSYARAKALPRMPENDFKTWVSNRFGRRLFEIFFKTYTEKVWGIPCDRISSEWATQRIQGLSLTGVVLNSLRLTRGGRKREIKSLIREFQYPRKGPGMMWSRLHKIVEARGSRLFLTSPVKKIFWEPGRVVAVEAGESLHTGSHFLSSIPIRELIMSLEPEPPREVARAAGDFNYRDFLTVVLLLRGKNFFPDNWIYIHDPGVNVGRIQNYNNWSPDMVPDPETTCIGLEYFCSEGDALWRRSDEELIEQAKAELSKIGLVDPASVFDATVLRVRKAYPVYDENYRRGISAIRHFLNAVPNLQLIGRNGMHRYNNQDHSMLTAILAAR
ncbi:MAG TPA: NAD(P)/FAD-dependent oxidoreductase, partial [Blastocatellia bacterium]